MKEGAPVRLVTRKGECLEVTFERPITTASDELLLEYGRRPANPIPFQADVYFDTVGNLDEGNVAVHPVDFTI